MADANEAVASYQATEAASADLPPEAAPVAEPAPATVPLDPVLVMHLVKLAIALILLPIILFKWL